MTILTKKLAIAAAAVAGVLAGAGTASAQVSNFHPCATQNPGPTEVFIFRDGNFQGPCAALSPGFYPHGANLGIGNDQLSSFKVGSAVRVSFFSDDNYAAAILTSNPAFVGVVPNGWNDRVSSARVQPTLRSFFCNDLRVNEYALFRDANGRGDCVVLSIDMGDLLTVDEMGIANDSVSSVVVGPRDPNLPSNERLMVELHHDTFGGGASVDIDQPGSIADLSTVNFNDQASSVEIIEVITTP